MMSVCFSFFGDAWSDALTKVREEDKGIPPPVRERYIEGCVKFIANGVLTITTGNCIQLVLDVSPKCLYEGLGPSTTILARGRIEDRELVRIAFYDETTMRNCQPGEALNTKKFITVTRWTP